MRHATIIFALLSFSSCDLSGIDLSGPDDLPNCSSEGGTIEVVADQRLSVTPVTGSILVTGIARHPRGLTIQRLLVGSVPATNTSFNFATWSAELSAAALARLAASPDAGSPEAVVIPIVAFDVCDVGAPRGKATFTASVQAAPQTRVTRLRVVRVADGLRPEGTAPLTAPVVLELRANLEASGVSVRLELSPGTSGATFANGAAQTSVTLLPSDTDEAIARVAVTGREPGTAVITALAGAVAAGVPVRFVGPPRVFPATQSPIPGQRVVVTALSDGEVSQCELSPATSAAFTVTGFDASGVATVGRQTAEFEIVRTAATGPGLTVTCRDTFGQSSRATIAAGVTPP
jgi:hypothetical protein